MATTSVLSESVFRFHASETASEDGVAVRCFVRPKVGEHGNPSQSNKPKCTPLFDLEGSHHTATLKVPHDVPGMAVYGTGKVVVPLADDSISDLVNDAEWVNLRDESPTSVAYRLAVLRIPNGEYFGVLADDPADCEISLTAEPSLRIVGQAPFAVITFGPFPTAQALEAALGMYARDYGPSLQLPSKLPDFHQRGLSETPAREDIALGDAEPQAAGLPMAADGLNCGDKASASGAPEDEVKHPLIEDHQLGSVCGCELGELDGGLCMHSWPDLVSSQTGMPDPPEQILLEDNFDWTYELQDSAQHQPSSDLPSQVRSWVRESTSRVRHDWKTSTLDELCQANIYPPPAPRPASSKGDSCPELSNSNLVDHDIALVAVCGESADRLVCFCVGNNSGHLELRMENPAGKVFRHLLPSIYCISRVQLMNLRLDAGEDYKVFLVGSTSQGKVITLEYSSESGVFAPLPDPPTHFLFSGYQNGAYYKDPEGSEFLFCVAKHPGTEYIVLKHDLLQEAWEGISLHRARIRIHDTISRITNAHFVQCGGSVYLHSEQEVPNVEVIEKGVNKKKNKQNFSVIHKLNLDHLKRVKWEEEKLDKIKNHRDKKWGAEEIMTLLKVTIESLQNQPTDGRTRRIKWAEISDVLRNRYNINRSSGACQRNWDTLQRRTNEVDNYVKVNNISGTSSSWAIWDMSDGDRSRNKLPPCKEYTQDTYDTFKSIRDLKSRQLIDEKPKQEKPLPSQDTSAAPYSFSLQSDSTCTTNAGAFTSSLLNNSAITPITPSRTPWSSRPGASTSQLYEVALSELETVVGEKADTNKLIAHCAEDKIQLLRVNHNQQDEDKDEEDEKTKNELWHKFWEEGEKLRRHRKDLKTKIKDPSNSLALKREYRTDLDEVRKEKKKIKRELERLEEKNKT